MFTHILVTILVITVVILLVTLYHAVGKACDERKSLLELAKEFDEFRNMHRKKLEDLERVRDSERLYYKDELKRLDGTIRELNGELDNRKKLSGVKFTARVPTSGWTKTEFTLGNGKCGKEVIALTFTEELDHYLLTQFHSDTTRKTFKYLKEDVAGRIELAYH